MLTVDLNDSAVLKGSESGDYNIDPITTVPNGMAGRL